eukprot:jgi/Chlat1/575/Chrsp103S01141
MAAAAAAAAELRGAPQQDEESRRLSAAEAQLAHATALRARLLLPRTEEAGGNIPDFLPGRLHYDVMVPFGSAAFFPGRLIHTNEFMVSLGDGGVHQTERSATQAARILQRHVKGAEREAAALRESVRASKARARALEGLLDIREDYNEEAQDEGRRATTSEVSRRDVTGMRGVADDEEHARVMRRLAELEHAEEEAETAEAEMMEEDVEEGEAGAPHSEGTQSMPPPRSTQAQAQLAPTPAKPTPQRPLVSPQPQPHPKEEERGARAAAKQLPATSSTTSSPGVAASGTDTTDTSRAAAADAFRGRVLERPNIPIAASTTTTEPAAAAAAEPAKRVSRFKQRAAERHA